MPRRATQCQTVSRKASTEKSGSADVPVLLMQAQRMESRGDLVGAVEQYQSALRGDPRSFAAWNNLGSLFASLKDWPTAKTFFEEAERVNPRSVSVLHNLGNVLGKCGQPGPSVERYQAALALGPGNAQTRNCLGNALRVAGDLHAAEGMLLSAIALQGNYPAAHANLGFLYYMQGRFAEAEASYRTAIEFDPHYAQAHACLSKLLLRRGCFLDGWEEQEWRWQVEDFPSPKRNFTQPQWKGESLAGKRILLHAEQGLGDTIQFVRYVPMVAARGAEVTLEVLPELLGLMRSLAGVSFLMARGESLGWFDYHCPLMSLPLAFRTTLETIPNNVPYLHSYDPVPGWADRGAGEDLRVGLVWAGNPENSCDATRSLTPEVLEPVFSVPGVEFYSFQRRRAGSHDETRLSFCGVLPETGDLAFTAAAIKHMDLVISVDTAVAHLAGALGVPVWILLANVSDWRWLATGSSGPWYPTATLFRQRDGNGWGTVVAEVRDSLQAWSKQRAGPSGQRWTPR